MTNSLYVEVFSIESADIQLHVNLPLESLITYCIYKYCESDINLILVFVKPKNNIQSFRITISTSESRDEMKYEDLPWQVKACNFPAIWYKDMIQAGLCAVARHICKYRNCRTEDVEYYDGLLGFKAGCLQAPNEVSIWTKFCEVDIINMVNQVLCLKTCEQIPLDLVRFEIHLKQPVKMHNIYKIAKEFEEKNTINVKDNPTKSEKKKAADMFIQKEDLNLCHSFAEGSFLTLADIILYPAIYIIKYIFTDQVLESHMPLTYKWIKNLEKLPNVITLKKCLDTITNIKQFTCQKFLIPEVSNVSLYKCDQKRHNPKRRLYTKHIDIEDALNAIKINSEIKTSENKIKNMDWSVIPEGANPNGGHLPDSRSERKTQQLENLTQTVMNLAKDNDIIVDFCSGSGHLGILLAYLLPKCIVFLLENKEQSLLRARARIHTLKLKNVYFYQCNLDYFKGKFDIGVALHACGIATDLVLDKCLQSNAKFVLCPCCYGSLHLTHRLKYPRSEMFSSLSPDQYICIGHAADQTHTDHPLEVRARRCMSIIDSDRGRLAEQYGYKVLLTQLKPLTCTPKNNLIIGLPNNI